MKNSKPLSVLTISCLGILVYSNTFHCSFHFDDFSSIVTNPAIRNIDDLQGIWNFLPRRFILYLSIALNYHFNGLHVFGYHLFNLTVHLISAILVWWLTLLTFSTPAMNEQKMVRDKNIIALFAGLIFVSHPLQTQAVTYIVQRAASMATMFYLTSICLYIKSKLPQPPGLKKFYYTGSLLAAIAAMFTKETAITLPLVILLYDHYFLGKRPSLNWRSTTPFLLTLLIIPITMLLTETSSARLQQLQNEPGISSMNYLLTQFRVIVTYIRLVFLPIHQSMDYAYPIFNSVFELPVTGSIIFLTATLYGAKRLFLKHRLISFSIIWFFLTLMPESSFLPIKDVIEEHRLYLPMAGFSIFLASSIYYIIDAFRHSESEGRRIFRSIKILRYAQDDVKYWFMIILTIIITCYSVLTFQRNRVWKDEITLWADNLKKSPHNSRAFNDHGYFLIMHDNYVQALADFNKAIELNPLSADAYNNRGTTYFHLGNYTQAIADFNKAIELNPHSAELYHNRDLAYAKQDQKAPVTTNGFERGFTFFKQGDYTEAIANFTEAIKINPGLAQAYNDRGLAYYKLNDNNHAIVDFNKAIKLNPAYADAFYNRGLAYDRRDNSSQTIADFNKAIALNPDYGEVYSNRAIVYYRLKEYDKARADADEAKKLGADVNPELISALGK